MRINHQHLFCRRRLDGQFPVGIHQLIAAGGARLRDIV
jgi:hypothetical protein